MGILLWMCTQQNECGEAVKDPTIRPSVTNRSVGLEQRVSGERTVYIVPYLEQSVSGERTVRMFRPSLAALYIHSSTVAHYTHLLICLIVYHVPHTDRTHPPKN